MLHSAIVGGTLLTALTYVYITVFTHFFLQPLPIGSDGDGVRTTDWVVSHVRSAVGNLQGKIRVSVYVCVCVCMGATGGDVMICM